MAHHGTSMPELVLQQVVALGAQQTVESDLEGVVREKRDERRAEADRFAERLRDVGVKAAERLHVSGHRHEGDGEDPEHQAGDRVDQRRADAADEDGERRDAGHDGERGGRGDHHEDDAAGAEGALRARPVAALHPARSSVPCFLLSA